MPLFNTGLHKEAVDSLEVQQELVAKLRSMGIHWTPNGVVGPDGQPLHLAPPAGTQAEPPPQVPSKLVVVRHESGTPRPEHGSHGDGQGILGMLGARLHDMILDDKPAAPGK